VTRLSLVPLGLRLAILIIRECALVLLAKRENLGASEGQVVSQETVSLLVC